MEKIITNGTVSSSFRDTSGFLFYKNGLLYRQINIIYKENYDHLMNSGLYKKLVDSELLLPHEEADIESGSPQQAYKIIKPELIPFISYPYEWCFSQLKDAALTILEIQRQALEFGMSLKDCSAYNIQFRKSKPILIDTLSLEKYQNSEPWPAYRQFCQYFLAPLAIMSYVDTRLNQLLRIYIDGMPLDLASSILPLRTNFKFSLFSHIHLHAKSQKYFANKMLQRNKFKMNRLSFLGLVDNLKAIITKLKCKCTNSGWGGYYRDANYSSDGFIHKQEIVGEFLDKLSPKIVWDLGANVGIFSRIASKKGMHVISFDNDFNAVEENYRYCIKNKEINILPLLIDLTNPSPALGWQNRERMSLMERGPADAILALALIHHLAISNNIPLDYIADFFGKICNSLIIEFVPKNDSQVQRLLAYREDIFPDYTIDNFEKAFKKIFGILTIIKIKDSERILYLMKKR